MAAADAKREGRGEKPPGAMVAPVLSDVDKAVLATEVPAEVKASGKAVLAAEVHAGIKASDIHVQVAASYPQIMLEYRMRVIIALGVFCIAFIVAWCLGFYNPRAVFYDDNTTTTGDMQLLIYKNGLTFVRTVLPAVLTTGVGYVITTTDVYHEVVSTHGRTIRSIIKKAIAVLFCLPLGGVTIQMQPRSHPKTSASTRHCSSVGTGPTVPSAMRMGSTGSA